tara:strand:+ start:7526 stop:9016 length:1491 start_codon:yes stop_codon:yes gene_type:complete
MAEYLDPRNTGPGEGGGGPDGMSLEELQNLINTVNAAGMMAMAPVDEIQIQQEVDRLEAKGPLVDTTIPIRQQAIQNVQNRTAKLPQFIFQASFDGIPNIFKDETGVLYKYDSTGKLLIDNDGDGYPIIEIPAKNIEFESQTFREVIDCEISDELVAENPLPDSAPLSLKLGSRNFEWIKDEAGKRIPNSNYWQWPNSPSPEAENLIDFTYVFYKNSSPLFFIFDAINYKDIDTKLAVNTGLKYKFFLDGELVKEGNFGRDEYFQIHNAQPKDEAIQTITAEIYNDFGSTSVNQKFLVVENQARTKNFIWCWDDLITRPNTRHGGLVSLDYENTGVSNTSQWDWRRALLHLRCTNFDDIPEYYKDTWQVEINVYAPNFGITNNQYGNLNTERDDTGTRFRPRKRIFTLREIHETDFMIWADPATGPTIELRKIPRSAAGRPTEETENLRTGDQPIEIASGKTYSKKLIPFTIYEDEIIFNRNNDPQNPFNNYKEPA